MRARAALGVAALLLAGCGGGGDGGGEDKPPTTVSSTKVEVLKGAPSRGFAPEAIYRRESPGVVTVISYFGGRRGLGSGFVLDGRGEIVTNAHVVAAEGRERAREVYVQFADGNEVRARILGTDPNADTALLRIDTGGLTLRSLPVGSSGNLRVGEPVAVIGSPFGERQSLSVGVVSALDRTIGSLTRFQIAGAIQTDAAINQGNSGGPLLDAGGRVVGIVSSFASSSGANEGVGYAIPIDAVKRSVRQLRASGRVRYAYLGVSTTPVYPQLARRLGLSATQGALVQETVSGGPARKAGIRAGDREIRFQGQRYRAGGDLITSVGGQAIRRDSDVSSILSAYQPGDTVAVDVVRGHDRRTVRVKLGTRP